MDGIFTKPSYWCALEPTVSPVSWYFEFEQPITVYRMDVHFEYKASIENAYIKAGGNCQDSAARISAAKYGSFGGRVIFPIEEPKRPHKCFFVVLQLKETHDGKGNKKYPAIAEVQFFQGLGEFSSCASLTRCTGASKIY